MRRITALALACAFLGSAAAAQETGIQETEAQEAGAPQAAPSLRFAGSNTIGARLIPELARLHLESSGHREILARQGETAEDRILSAVAPDGSEAAVAVSSHGSGTAFSALKAGAADLGMSSRPARPEELEAFAPSGLEAHVLGLDGVSVIVHPGNPVENLTLAQIREIFSGAAADWSAFAPGASGPIQVLARDANSGTYETFRSLAMGGEPMVETARRFESNADLAASVAKDPQAIGFVGGAPGGARPLAIRQDCGLISSPEAYALKTEEYPLSRRLFLYNDPTRTPAAAEAFVAFALSEAAAPALAASEFMDLEVVESAPGYGGEAIQRMVLLADKSDAGLGDMQAFARFAASPEARRLSVTFRFKFGSADLDERAAPDVQRLAAWWRGLKERQPQRRLAVLGFADGVGPYAVNRRLSLERARAVEAELAAAGLKADLAEGWGEIAPVACDWDAQGRLNELGQSKNRRVEVWIY